MHLCVYLRGGDRRGVRRAHERDVMRLAVSLSHSPAMIRVNVVGDEPPVEGE